MKRNFPTRGHMEWSAGGKGIHREWREIEQVGTLFFLSMQGPSNAFIVDHLSFWFQF